jgi:hypothetical protein
MTTTKRAAPMDDDLSRALAKEHREIRSLCDQIAACGAATARRELFTRLKEELLAHGRAEEETLYAVASTTLGNGEILVRGVEEHGQLGSLLRKLEGADVDGAWMAAFAVLTGVLDEHVRWEEVEVLPRLSDALEGKEAAVLSSHYAEAKARVLGSLRRGRRPTELRAH